MLSTGMSRLGLSCVSANNIHDTGKMITSARLINKQTYADRQMQRHAVTGTAARDVCDACLKDPSQGAVDKHAHAHVVDVASIRSI
jgi:hypothetical protein